MLTYFIERSRLFQNAFNRNNLEKLIFQLPLMAKTFNLLHIVRLIRHRGSYMSAHVLLNLLNEL